MKSGGRTYGKIIGSYKINVLRKKYPESTKLEHITFLNISAWKMSDLYIYIANLDLPHVNAFRKRATPIHLLIVFDRSSSEVVALEITWHASSVEFSRVWLFVTPWTAAHQASLSITNSWSFLKFMSIELVLPSSVIPLSSHLQSFPASGSFQMSQFFASGGQIIGASDESFQWIFRIYFL